MYAIIAEDDTDVATLKVIIRRLAKKDNLHIKGRGYNGCGEMLNKGGGQLAAYASLGYTKFLVCYDADCVPAAKRHSVAYNSIIKKARLRGNWSIIIPVQEIEAWMLADLDAVEKVVKLSNVKPIDNPEKIKRPKEHLRDLSIRSNHKPSYRYTVHNQQVAKHLDLSVLSKKCPSFQKLVRFVTGKAAFGNPRKGKRKNSR